MEQIERGKNLTTDERRTIDLAGQIKGWGSDLDKHDRPGVPRDKAPGLGFESLYIDVEPQEQRVRAHKSTEHGRMPPVYGTSCPPRGVSGKIRDAAFKLSEGKLSHWLLLMLADRVDMVEELVIDLAHLRIPNIPKEMGLGAELRYNRKNFYRKAAFGGAAVLAIAGFSVLGKRAAAR